MDRGTERAREVAISHGIRRGRVEDARRAVDRVEIDPDLIVEVDPGVPLSAARDRAAEPEFEERHESRERAARLSEHEPRADFRDRHAVRRRGVGGALPRDARFGEKIVPGRRVLVERRALARAVIADRGGRNVARRNAIEPSERRDQRLARVDPTRTDLRFDLRRPALGDGFARQIHHGVGSGAGGRRGGGIAQRSRRHRVAARAECRDERDADKAGGSEYGYVHRPLDARGSRVDATPSCLSGIAPEYISGDDDSGQESRAEGVVNCQIYR